MAPLLVALDKYHQDQMVAYQRLTSSKDVTFCIHNKKLCVDHGALV
jgi:hypothetical protein